MSYKYKAMDADGSWWHYEMLPIINSERSYWYAVKNDGVMISPPDHKLHLTWKESISEIIDVDSMRICDQCLTVSDSKYCPECGNKRESES